MSFDPRCHELADFFLQHEAEPPTETEINNLAQEIQDAIEDWIAFRRDFKAPKSEEPTP